MARCSLPSVSTLDQTTANQERELREIAGRMGCEIVRSKDHGISGAKARDERPAFDALCRDAISASSIW
jgi:DNA invertase Pin-like site-specific DNA recombinase